MSDEEKRLDYFDTIPIERIISVPAEYQVRDAHTEAEYHNLKENIEEEGRQRGRLWYLTKHIHVFPAIGQYAGSYAVYDGASRFKILKELGATELIVGADVEVDYWIKSKEQLFLKVLAANDNSKPVGWRGYAKAAKLMYDKFGWKQERIAEEIHRDQTVVSKYLAIMDKLSEVIDDPVFEELGVNRTLELCPFWGQKEWVKPRPILDDDKPRDARGLIVIDKGRAELERWKERARTANKLSEIPSEKTVHVVADKMRHGVPFAIAHGSREWDDKPEQWEARGCRAFARAAEKRAEDRRKAGLPPISQSVVMTDGMPELAFAHEGKDSEPMREVLISKFKEAAQELGVKEIPKPSPLIVKSKPEQPKSEQPRQEHRPFSGSIIPRKDQQHLS